MSTAWPSRTGLTSAGLPRRYTLTSSWGARKSSSIGPSTVSWARRHRASTNFMRTDSPYKTIEDVRKAPEPPKCGSGGATGTGFYFPRLLEETVGAKFNIVLGYQGGGPIDLAVEKGEIHCRAMTIESLLAGEPFHTWSKNNFVKSKHISLLICDDDSAGLP